jgi:hypothetical protein
MTLKLLHSEFPYIEGKFDFLFYQCIWLAFILVTRKVTGAILGPRTVGRRNNEWGEI